MGEQQANPSKGKIKYFPPQANTNCGCRKEVSNRLDTIVEILAEHKVLLDRLVSQNTIVENIMQIFPIKSKDDLKELDNILKTQKDPYIRQIKNLIAGNVERNLHLILSQTIIMEFNVDGIFGKDALRDFPNVLAAIIDAISTYNDSPDKTLRAAFQRQKKKFFKKTSRCNQKNKTTNENEENEKVEKSLSELLD